VLEEEGEEKEDEDKLEEGRDISMASYDFFKVRLSWRLNFYGIRVSYVLSLCPLTNADFLILYTTKKELGHRNL